MRTHANGQSTPSIDASFIFAPHRTLTVIIQE